MSTHKRSDEDFEKEVRAHLDLETDRFIEQGMDPAAARAAARRSFGNVASVKERFYESNHRLWLDHFIQDLHGAVRSIRRYPVAALVAVVSLAAGIGATAVTLTVRNLVFRAPPALYQQPNQLSRVQVGGPEQQIRRSGNLVPAPLFARWRGVLGTSIGGALPGRSRDLRIGDRIEPVTVRPVTPELFPLLGVGPAIGRALATPSSGADAPRVALLSHGVWQRFFDGRADVVGRAFWIDDQPYTVTGVMPERFWFWEMDAPVWTAIDERALAATDALETIVRRPAGVTAAMLDARLRAGLADHARTLPADRRQLSLRLSGVEGTPLGRQVSIALPYVLATAVILTLLIACANVAILMIAQWTGREHEIAVRAAIGASRSRIVRSLLTESVLIASIGGTLGVAATLMLRGLIVRSGGSGFLDLSIDPWIFVQTAAIAIGTGIVAGVAPALYETRRLQHNPLRLMAGADRVRQRLRHALVVFEITVTVALLVVTSAMIGGYLKVQNAELGYATRPLITVRVDNPHGAPTMRTLEVLRQLPRVDATAASTSIPFAAHGTMVVAGIDAAGSDGVRVEQGAIAPGFFATLGVPMRTGRDFSSADSTAMRTAILSEGLGLRLFPGRSAVGGQVWVDGTPYDIVGTVADYSSNPFLPTGSELRMFVPLPPESPAVERMTFLVRATSDPGLLAETIVRDVRAAVPGTIVRAGAVEQTMTVMGQEMLVGTAPLFPLIAIGILLTMAGVYGVLAFAISRRSRELAVRVAVGATRQDVVALVSAHSAWLVTLGTVFGLGLTFVLARLLRANGGAGSMFDPGPAAFVVPVLTVIGIGVVATWLPARRASRIDPIVLLRNQ
jgi:putative ABC transport system permease protein